MIYMNSLVLETISPTCVALHSSMQWLVRSLTLAYTCYLKKSKQSSDGEHPAKA